MSTSRGSPPRLTSSCQGDTLTEPIRRVLSCLRGVRPQHRDRWLAFCPAHDDRRPSLSVGLSRSGTALLHCHAGCDTDDVLRALGLSWADLEPPTPSAPRLVATYDHAGAAGRLLFQVTRYEPKTFRRRRPDGAGGWLWGLAGVPRVLYRLPQLLAAQPHRLVFIVEGEKDAGRLAALDFPVGERSIPPELIEPLLRWHARLGLPAVTISGESGAGRAIHVRPLEPTVCSLGDGVFDGYYQRASARLVYQPAVSTAAPPQPPPTKPLPLGRATVYPCLLSKSVSCSSQHLHSPRLISPFPHFPTSPLPSSGAHLGTTTYENARAGSPRPPAPLAWHPCATNRAHPAWRNTMPWERRSNRQYYYRKQRCGGRVLSEYIGSGSLAQAAARLDARRGAERHDLCRERDQERALDAELDALEAALQAVIAAILIAGGHHQHRGQWRRQRER